MVRHEQTAQKTTASKGNTARNNSRYNPTRFDSPINCNFQTDHKDPADGEYYHFDGGDNVRVNLLEGRMALF